MKLQFHGLTGMSQIELAVVLALVAAISGALLSALVYFEELGEKTAVDLTIRNIRTGIRLEMARQIAGGASPDMHGLIASNPIVWLERPPPGFRGVLEAGDARRLEAGGWYFDAGRRELVYKPRLTFHFRVPEHQAPVIRWRLSVRSTAQRSEHWPELAPVTPYSWF